MSDLKTWPEEIWIENDEEDIPNYMDTGDLEIAFSSPTTRAPIKYIRADVVKEREEKLIDAAICHHSVIYKEAGLEELK